MLTTDKNNPLLKETNQVGQQKAYLILSEEERAKGFIRPLRTTYKHVGKKPKYPLRDLTKEEHERYDKFGYIKFEEYPEEMSPQTGRYWTEKDLNSGCGAETKMALELSETYARQPDFYGATFCVGCGKHLPVDEFIWIEDGERVGS